MSRAGYNWLVTIYKEDSSLDKSFYQRVYEQVKQIPSGKVATYGQIALLAGSPRAARIVGGALHQNPEPFVIPCHRVVNRMGGLAPAFAFGGAEVQRRLLEEEGVTVQEGDIVDLAVFGWRAQHK